MSTEQALFTQGSLLRHVSVMSFTSNIGLMAIIGRLTPVAFSVVFA